MRIHTTNKNKNNQIVFLRRSARVSLRKRVSATMIKYCEYVKRQNYEDEEKDSNIRMRMRQDTSSMSDRYLYI